MPDLTKLADLPALQQLARALWHKRSIRGAALIVGAGFSKNAILQAPDTPEPPSGLNHTFESGRSADERPKTGLIRWYQVLDSNH